MQQTLWEHIKKLSPTTWAAPRDKNSAHPQSILSRPVKFPQAKKRKVATKGKTCPSNHDRVVMSRAAKMGLTVEEYKIKFS